MKKTKRQLQEHTKWERVKVIEKKGELRVRGRREASPMGNQI